MITIPLIDAIALWVAMHHGHIQHIQEELDALRDQLDQLDERLDEVCDA